MMNRSVAAIDGEMAKALRQASRPVPPQPKGFVPLLDGCQLTSHGLSAPLAGFFSTISEESQVQEPLLGHGCAELYLMKHLAITFG